MLHKWHDKWINKIEDFICAPETCFWRMEIITPSAAVVVVLLQCSVFHTLPCLKSHRKSSSAHQNFYEDSIRNFIPDFVISDPTVKLQIYLELLYSYSEVIDGKSCSLSICDVWLAILGDVCIFCFDILRSPLYMSWIFFLISVSNEIQRMFHSVLFQISFSIDLFVLHLQYLEKSFNQPPPLDFYLTLVVLSMHPGTTCKLQDVDSSAVSAFMVRRNALLAPGEEFVMG